MSQAIKLFTLYMMLLFTSNIYAQITCDSADAACHLKAINSLNNLQCDESICYNKNDPAHKDDVTKLSNPNYNPDMCGKCLNVRSTYCSPKYGRINYHRPATECNNGISALLNKVIIAPLCNKIGGSNIVFDSEANLCVATNMARSGCPESICWDSSKPEFADRNKYKENQLYDATQCNKCTTINKVNFCKEFGTAGTHRSATECDSAMNTYLNKSILVITSECNNANYMDNALCDIVTDDERNALAGKEFNVQELNLTLPIFDYDLNSKNPKRECNLGTIKYKGQTIVDCAKAESENDKYICEKSCEVNSCSNKATFQIDPKIIKEKFPTDNNVKDYFTDPSLFIPMQFNVNLKTDHNDGVILSSTVDTYSCIFDVNISQSTAEIDKVSCQVSKNGGALQVHVKDKNDYTVKFAEVEKNCK